VLHSVVARRPYLLIKNGLFLTENTIIHVLDKEQPMLKGEHERLAARPPPH
jgi:hypothetical protein